MSNQKRIDKIFDASIQSIQEEISALIGTELSVKEPTYTIMSKEEVLDELLQKQILAKIDVEGDLQGEGYLFVPVKAAIRLGGTLIMLPPAELDEVVADEVYNEETEDSYGEIANIVVGAYSKNFEEMYPQAVRLIRKEQELVTPAKIDIDSDDPVKNISYYVVTQQMELGGNDIGMFVLMLPAAPFGLVEEEAEPAQEEQTEQVSEDQGSESPAEQEATSQDDSGAEGTQEKGPSDAIADAIEADEEDVVKYDPKNIDKLNKILDETQSRITEEVGGLIGVEFELSDTSYDFYSKEQLFDELMSKQVMAHMDIKGDIQGKGALFVGVKDAIRLGGTLIMLPQTELEETVGREEYNEETEDSYGEIANIIAGSYSKVLEEMYPKNCRLIRLEQELIHPAKVDGNSDEPIANITYYVVRNTINLNGVICSDLIMALPAVTFGILDPAAMAEKVADPSSTDDHSPADSVTESTAQKAEEGGVAATDSKSYFDSEKQKKVVDKLLDSCKSAMEDEMAAMLGTEITFTDAEKKLVSKEDFFFDEVTGKQVLAHMDVLSEQLDENGKSYLFLELRDAIRIGGTLIMLPPSELDNSIVEEDFNDDCQDAYGEIANIIAGCYTGIFEENYPQKFRFVRKQLENVLPLKVDIESNEPVTGELFYLYSLIFNMGGQALGKVQMLIPAELVQLERLGEKPPETQAEAAKDTAQGAAASAARTVDTSTDIILIGNDEVEAAKINSVLDERGFKVKTLSFKDNIFDHAHDGIQAIFLVMQEVNEVGFGVAIKISTASRSPLIAAGPAWTRTTVIKAVKYGVTDILLTPSELQDIEAKLDNNLVKLAA